MDEVAQLEFINLNPIYYKILPFMKEEDENNEPGPINVIIQAVGQYFLMFILIAILLMFYVILLYINWIEPKFKIFDNLTNFLFWNAPIRQILESYLDFTLLAFTQLYNLGFQW